MSIASSQQPSQAALVVGLVVTVMLMTAKDGNAPCTADPTGLCLCAGHLGGVNRYQPRPLPVRRRNVRRQRTFHRTGEDLRPPVHQMNGPPLRRFQPHNSSRGRLARRGRGDSDVTAVRPGEQPDSPLSRQAYQEAVTSGSQRTSPLDRSHSSRAT